MTEPKIVPQKQFESLEDFTDGQNNYYAHFLKGDSWGETRRERPHFQRFQNLHPELEGEVTRATGEARSKSGRLPYERLFEAYKIMSQLVYADDKGLMAYSNPDEYLIA